MVHFYDRFRNRSIKGATLYTRRQYHPIVMIYFPNIIVLKMCGFTISCAVRPIDKRRKYQTRIRTLLMRSYDIVRTRYTIGLLDFPTAV